MVFEPSASNPSGFLRGWGCVLGIPGRSPAGSVGLLGILDARPGGGWRRGMGKLAPRGTASLTAWFL